LVNLADGQTLKADLQTDEGANGWRRLESDLRRQSKIRGVTFNSRSHAVSVTPPRCFRQYRYRAEACKGPSGEPVGERLILQADDIQLTVLRYSSGMVRIDLARVGYARHMGILGGD